jgi:hypothetical protein
MAFSARKARSLQFALVVEQGVEEGHAAAQHRRAGLVAENDVIAGLAQFHGKRRGGLVGPQYHRQIGVGGRNKIGKGRRAHGLPSKNRARDVWFSSVRLGKAPCIGWATRNDRFSRPDAAKCVGFDASPVGLFTAWSFPLR